MSTTDTAEPAESKPVHEPTYTIAEFCRAENISQPTYAKMRANGLGPREMRFPISNIVRITHRARLAWQEMHENPTPEQAAKMEALAEKNRAKSRRGAAASILSPLHISNVRRAAREAREAEAAAAAAGGKRKRARAGR